MEGMFFLFSSVGKLMGDQKSLDQANVSILLNQKMSFGLRVHFGAVGMREQLPGNVPIALDFINIIVYTDD